MEKIDRLEEWVHQRMAAPEPAAAWPDPAAGRRLLDRRIAARQRPLMLWAGAAAALCAAVLVLPGPRLAAQRLWDRVVLGRIQVLIADLDVAGAASGFFSPQNLRLDVRSASSIGEASERAGFWPRLPDPDVFPGSPTYSVADATLATLPLRTPAIRYLVARAGGSPGEVPDSWNGAMLEVRVGPVILADYGGVVLLQSLPFELVKPVDFDLELFYRIAFQALGASELYARSLGADLAVNPALLMFMPREDSHLVHEFPTRSGNGVMIGEVYGPGSKVALWSGSDRLYALFSGTGKVTSDFLIRVANTLD
ncbi:MAG TPA: hypothetical protein VFO58_24320 [Vicinamibacterales bacterium]|nr:hypothetical protein [Vicinamibacterales bacterium]